MNPDTLREIVEDAVYHADRLRIVIDVLLVVVVGIAGAIGSYWGAYLKTRGKNLATKDDFDNLLEQGRKTTQATEEVRRQIQGWSEFRDKVLMERYTLIKDINQRLETVRIGWERLKKGLPTRLEIVNGETLMLTESTPICS